MVKAAAEKGWLKSRCRSDGTINCYQKSWRQCHRELLCERCDTDYGIII